MSRSVGGILDPRAGADDGVGDETDRFVLADHPLVEHRVESEELFPLALLEPADRDAGPVRRSRRSRPRSRPRADGAHLLGGELLLGFLQAALQLGELAVTQLGGGQGRSSSPLPRSPDEPVPSGPEAPAPLAGAAVPTPTATASCGIGLQVGELLSAPRDASCWRRPSPCSTPPLRSRAGWRAWSARRARPAWSRSPFAAWHTPRRRGRSPCRGGRSVM